MLRAMLKFARSAGARSLGLGQDVTDDGAIHMKYVFWVVTSLIVIQMLHFF